MPASKYIGVTIFNLKGKGGEVRQGMKVELRIAKNGGILFGVSQQINGTGEISQKSAARVYDLLSYALRGKKETERLWGGEPRLNSRKFPEEFDPLTDTEIEQITMNPLCLLSEEAGRCYLGQYVNKIAKSTRNALNARASELRPVAAPTSDDMVLEEGAMGAGSGTLSDVGAIAPMPVAQQPLPGFEAIVAAIAAAQQQRAQADAAAQYAAYAARADNIYLPLAAVPMYVVTTGVLPHYYPVAGSGAGAPVNPPHPATLTIATRTATTTPGNPASQMLSPYPLSHAAPMGDTPADTPPTASAGAPLAISSQGQHYPVQGAFKKAHGQPLADATGMDIDHGIREAAGALVEMSR